MMAPRRLQGSGVADHVSEFGSRTNRSATGVESSENYLSDLKYWLYRRSSFLGMENSKGVSEEIVENKMCLSGVYAVRFYRIA
jgi:hypothetical protein